MFGMKLSGKTTPPGSKADVQISPVALPLPSSVLLPLLSASDLPLTATVKLGDTVQRGQVIAGSSATPPFLHAPISGKIGKPEEYLSHDGKTVPAIRIEGDGENTLVEGLAQPALEDVNSLLEALTASGIVDRSGMPLSSLLYTLTLKTPEIIVLNGAEDEGMSVADLAALFERAEAVSRAVAILRRYAPKASVHIAVRRSDKAALGRVREIFSEQSGV